MECLCFSKRFFPLKIMSAYFLPWHYKYLSFFSIGFHLQHKSFWLLYRVGIFYRQRFQGWLVHKQCLNHISGQHLKYLWLSISDVSNILLLRFRLLFFRGWNYSSFLGIWFVKRCYIPVNDIATKVIIRKIILDVFTQPFSSVTWSLGPSTITNRYLSVLIAIINHLLQ